MSLSKRDMLKLMSGASVATLAACSGGGGGGSGSTGTSPPPPPPPPPPTGPATGLLRDTYSNNFLVGAAVGSAQIAAGSDDAALLSGQFNSITAENVMKPTTLAPTEGNFDFTQADALLAFAQANGISLRGHTLLWHQQTPSYFFNGSTAEIRTRLEAYITAVVTHFSGSVYAWDVVNEVISDDAGATSPYRDSNWYQAVGPDYIDWAFQAARAADPNVKLFINEYSTEFSGKRARLMQVVQDMLNRNIPLDGVGHQLHTRVSSDATGIMAAIDAVDALGAGLENHITELDVSLYDDPGECFASGVNCATGYGTMATDVPTNVYQAQAQLYRDLFNGFVQRPTVTSVSTWGISDAQSWLNTFPVSRSNYPLLFDPDRQPKSAFLAITDPSYQI